MKYQYSITQIEEYFKFGLPKNIKEALDSLQNLEKLQNNKFKKIKEYKDIKSKLSEDLQRFCESKLQKINNQQDDNSPTKHFSSLDNFTDQKIPFSKNQKQFKQSNHQGIIEKMIAEQKEELLSKNQLKTDKFMDSQIKNIRKQIEIDNRLLQNIDGQTMEVSFDQNRQLLRGFCLLFKPKALVQDSQFNQSQNNSITHRDENLSRLRSQRLKNPNSFDGIKQTGIQQQNIQRLGQMSKQNQQDGTRFMGAQIQKVQNMGYQVEETYCYCQNISYGDMIACDCPKCSIEWFHFPCVGLTKKPESNYGDSWYCPDCIEKFK